MNNIITNFLNSSGQVKQLPSKKAVRNEILIYLSEFIQDDTIYSEREINEILNSKHTFGDPALLRRDMFDNFIINRTSDCRLYWKNLSWMFLPKYENDLFILRESNLSDEEILRNFLEKKTVNIGKWSGYKSDYDQTTELLNHLQLPEKGYKEFDRVDLIFEKTSDELIGVLQYYQGHPDKNTLWLGYLCISKDFQRKKYGTNLVTWISDEAKSRDYKKIMINVDVKNWPALKFWFKNGFNKITKVFGDDVLADDKFLNMHLERDL